MLRPFTSVGLKSAWRTSYTHDQTFLALTVVLRWRNLHASHSVSSLPDVARPADAGDDDIQTSFGDVSTWTQAATKAEDGIVDHVGILAERLAVGWKLGIQPSIGVKCGGIGV